MSSCRLLLFCFALSSFVSVRPVLAQNALKVPEWVHRVTRMAFLTPGEFEKGVESGAQVFHFNLVWPYYPLKREGGTGLSANESQQLRAFVKRCHEKGIKGVLGLPPFPSVGHITAYPEWRIDPDGSRKVRSVLPREDDLSTRLACNNSPWGDYLIDLLTELLTDYQLDGFSFDGNYHPPICRCVFCAQGYLQDTKRTLPFKVDLDDTAYRQYLVWRGERLEAHYRKMQAGIKAVNPNAVIMTWTVNAGRYGQLLYSPRAMPTSLNHLFDLPMQEWWLDETNLGSSIAPAFGAAYLHSLAGASPSASEPYLMSHGNPYGTHSFPAHERLVRSLLAITNGNITAQSLGWEGHYESAKRVFREVGLREKWLLNTQKVPHVAMLVSEQTRQFVAYKDIVERFLPPIFGVFRMAFEEHLPLDILSDWEVTPHTLSRYRVLILPNAVALSTTQVSAIREYVRAGGGLIATGETSLCDELGRPQTNFTLSDVLGVTYQGVVNAQSVRTPLDVNFAQTLSEEYWQKRVGVSALTWQPHPLFTGSYLKQLVPRSSVVFRGSAMRIVPTWEGEVVARFTPESDPKTSLPAIIARKFGKGRVVTFATGFDSAYWSYSYPYQRVVLANATAWAAQKPFPITVHAPMAVQATFFQQADTQGKRIIVHLWNGVNTTANHGLPANEVPLREESILVHGIQIDFQGLTIRRVHAEPVGKTLPLIRNEKGMTIEVPPLDIHTLIVVELGERVATQKPRMSAQGVKSDKSF